MDQVLGDEMKDECPPDVSVPGFEPVVWCWVFHLSTKRTTIKKDIQHVNVPWEMALVLQVNVRSSWKSYFVEKKCCKTIAIISLYTVHNIHEVKIWFMKKRGKAWVRKIYLFWYLVNLAISIESNNECWHLGSSGVSIEKLLFMSNAFITKFEYKSCLDTEF